MTELVSSDMTPIPIDHFLPRQPVQPSSLLFLADREIYRDFYRELSAGKSHTKETALESVYHKSLMITN